MRITRLDCWVEDMKKLMLDLHKDIHSLLPTSTHQDGRCLPQRRIFFRPKGTVSFSPTSILPVGHTLRQQSRCAHSRDSYSFWPTSTLPSARFAQRHCMLPHPTDTHSLSPISTYRDGHKRLRWNRLIRSKEIH